MIRFNEDEINLICLYDPGNRAGTIYELRDMIRYLMPDEAELKTLAADVIAKLERMTDAEYDDMCNELIPPDSSEPDDGDTLTGLASLLFGDDSESDAEQEQS